MGETHAGMFPETPLVGNHSRASTRRSARFERDPKFPRQEGNPGIAGGRRRGGLFLQSRAESGDQLPGTFLLDGETGGAGRSRLSFVTNRIERGHAHDRQRGILAPQFADQLNALRRFQLKVGQDQVRAGGSDGDQRGWQIVSLTANAQVGLTVDAFNNTLPDRRLIFDNENSLFQVGFPFNSQIQNTSSLIPGMPAAGWIVGPADSGSRQASGRTRTGIACGPWDVSSHATGSA